MTSSDDSSNDTETEISPNIRHKIYGLVDPKYRRIGYIGTTTQPLSIRLSEHISETKRGRGSRAKREWIQDILDFENEDGPLTIVELPWPVHIHPQDWEAAEQYWIAYFRQAGHKLMNEADGGRGQWGTRHTEETKARIGEGVSRARAQARAGTIEVIDLEV